MPNINQSLDQKIRMKEIKTRINNTEVMKKEKIIETFNLKMIDTNKGEIIDNMKVKEIENELIKLRLCINTLIKNPKNINFVKL